MATTLQKNPVQVTKSWKVLDITVNNSLAWTDNSNKRSSKKNEYTVPVDANFAQRSILEVKSRLFTQALWCPLSHTHSMHVRKWYSSDLINWDGGRPCVLGWAIASREEPRDEWGLPP